MTKMAPQHDAHTDLADRIDLADKANVAGWMAILGVSKIQLAALVEKWGNSGAVIRRELRK